MKHLIRAAAALVLTLALGVPAFAHGTNAHVRGVVTQVTAKSVTVQLADNTTKTLTLSAKTTFERAGKPAAMTDLQRWATALSSTCRRIPARRSKCRSARRPRPRQSSAARSRSRTALEGRRNS